MGLKLVITGIFVLIIIVIIRALMLKPKKASIREKAQIDIDVQGAAEKLSEMVKCKTISSRDPSKTDYNEFKKLQDYMDSAFPLVHLNLKKETVNGYGLLYTWKGKEEGKKPILLMSHMDVVAIEDGTEKDWEYPPFSGAIEEGFVWGRGTLDIKIQVLSILEAVETLLKEGYEPDRDIYLAFGFDEEVGGYQGSTYIAQLLKERNIEFDFVLDEGGCVTEGGIEGIFKPIAVVGIGEKGYADIEFVAESGGGHASMPPRHTAVGEISRAIVDLEKRPMKTKITEPVKEMLRYVGPEMSFLNRIIIGNLWLFGGIFKKIFAANSSGNALLRTTAAPTIIEGSNSPNVLAQKSRAVVNFRILPGETSSELIEHIERTIHNPNIKIVPQRVDEPSNISSTRSKGYKIIEETIYQVFIDSLTTPYLSLGSTDARKYQIVCDNIYRFSPYQISTEDLSRMHGTNERISFDNIEKGIDFFIQLIINSTN
ncbi:M20 family peptidase [Clostridium sp. Cult3]|uniref:M20 family peptidase n=1 Tax=Clostridium sp. Cult3 TaxID=2079004 RepID=UPI001F33C78B|nr:M20 family peptidase [Clostridium sp. Cult3]MCF6460813.1 hypothetical protein [Clostridium sp. Cult3]